MKRVLILFVICLLLGSTACTDQMYLEEVDIALILGIDKSEEGKEQILFVAPIFDESVERPYQVISIQEDALLRNARKKANAKAIGSLSTRKLQLLLLSKELLKEKNIFPYLDAIFRNPKDEVHSRVAVVDGKVEDLVNFNWKKKGQPGVILKTLLDEGERSGVTLISQLFRYHRQMLDPRMTPYLSEIKKDEDGVGVIGTALLSRDGIYRTTLDGEESTYLVLLKGEMKTELSTKLRAPKKVGGEKGLVDLEIRDVKNQIQIQPKGNKAKITIHMKLSVDIAEQPFYYPVEQYSDQHQLEKILEEQFTREFTEVITKFQRYQVEPIGIGSEVQAQQYQWWKQIEKDWPRVFSRSQVQVHPEVTIHGFGISK